MSEYVENKMGEGATVHAVRGKGERGGAYNQNGAVDQRFAPFWHRSTDKLTSY